MAPSVPSQSDPRPPGRAVPGARRGIAAVATAGLALLLVAAPATAAPAPAAAPTTSAPAEAAAGWLARQLVDGSHLETVVGGTAYPDAGLTLDAVLAFAAAGVAGDGATSALAWLGQPANLGTYVGDGTTESYAGALAKLSLTAQVEGLDPAAYGSADVDLLSRLRALLAPSGRFSDKSQYGDFSNAFGQSYAILALDRAGGAPAAAVTYLAESECEAGGYPLDFEKPTCTPDTDATALVAQALAAAGATGAARGAVDWLLDQQRPDGSFGGGTSTEAPNANSTGVAAQALAAAGEDEAAAAAVAYLRTLQSGCAAPAGQRGAVRYQAGAVRLRHRAPGDRAGGAGPGRHRARRARRHRRRGGRAGARLCSDAHPDHPGADADRAGADPAAHRVPGRAGDPAGGRRGAAGDRCRPGAGGLARRRAGRRRRGARRRGAPPPAELAVSRCPRAGAGALAVGIAAAVTLLGPAPPAAAAACSGTSGVTVVVDYGPLGGGVRVSCAPGDPASGLAALSAAGYGYSFVPRQPGLVCQVNSKPNPCNGAPTNAYWSYWHASRGGSWSYSTSGAGTYNPRAGSVEGWAFGAGARPGVAPPAPAAAPPPPPPAPKPKPTARPTTRAPAPPAPAPGAPSRPGSSAAPGPGGGGTAAPPGRSAGGTATPSRTPTTGPPTGSAAGSTTVPPSDPAAAPATPVTEPVSNSSGLGRSVLGAAVVAALAAGGFLVARRRRAPS